MKNKSAEMHNFQNISLLTVGFRVGIVGLSVGYNVLL